MRTINHEELKAKLDANEPIKLVMVLDDWHYRAKHIPGSINLNSPTDALQQLSKNDEIIVYCTGSTCVASLTAYQFLEREGYQNVYRYAGGLTDWENAGYPVEGDWVYDNVE